MKHSSLMLSIFSALLISQVALAGQPVSSEEQFYEEASSACEGKSVGADCTIEFVGGHISFGFCVETSEGSGELTCSIDLSEVPNCKNNALGTQGSILLFASLGALLLFLRRRRQTA